MTNRIKIARRMFKKAVQRGRSERRGEAYSGYPLLFPVQRVQNVEPLSDARTKLADFFNILLGKGRGARRKRLRPLAARPTPRTYFQSSLPCPLPR
jgi:hypothetical protein